MGAPLVLASASPRRKELLEKLGFAVKTIPSNADETRDESEPPEDFVKRMARLKVLLAVRRLQSTLYTPEAEAARLTMPRAPREEPVRWVVGADTIVVLRDEIFEKPRDTAHAAEMLAALSDKEHMVLTGFCLFDLRKNKEGLQAVSTLVKFKKLSRGEIEKYLSLGESMDKAGAYAIQGVGAYLVEYIQGSYTNVVGLPVCQLVEMMEEMGANDVLPF
jgi:septum formation protein